MQHSDQKQEPINVRKLYRSVSTMEQKFNELKTVMELFMQQRKNYTVPQLLDGTEVMQLLKISRRTLYSYRRDGRLNGKMVGNKYLYRKEEVDNLLA
ncbi:MAG: helix-turn-helix domain-containing protein [Bacteroidales bacterium]|nr:helix-turn-helix domain-containing protein [Bacteroidales bacterium]